MASPSSRIRRAFIGVWIAAAAVLLMVGRAGGTSDALNALEAAPWRAAAAGPLAPTISVEVSERSGHTLD